MEEVEEEDTTQVHSAEHDGEGVCGGVGHCCEEKSGGKPCSSTTRSEVSRQRISRLNALNGYRHPQKVHNAVERPVSHNC